MSGLLNDLGVASGVLTFHIILRERKRFSSPFFSEWNAF